MDFDVKNVISELDVDTKCTLTILPKGHGWVRVWLGQDVDDRDKTYYCVSDLPTFPQTLMLFCAAVVLM